MSTNEEPKTSVVKSSRHAGRMSKWKRAAIIAAAVSAATIAVIAIVSFIPSGSEGFVIRLGNDTSAAHFTLLDGASGSSSAKTILRGTPLTNGWPTTAAEVNVHYDNTMASEEGLNGSQNLVDEGGHDLALMYTFYLRNDSNEEAAIYSLTSEVTNLVASTADNAPNLLDIVRILLVEGNVGEEEDYRCYFAAKSASCTYLDENDRRECVSNYNMDYIYDEDDIKVGSYRTPTYFDREIGFCEIFDTERDSHLLFSLSNRKIDPGKTRRVTYIAYLEDRDPEAAKAIPKDSSIGFNLTIGA